MKSNDITQGGSPKPRRAEPLQPDRPSRGDQAEPVDDDADAAQAEAHCKRVEQEQQALKPRRAPLPA